VANIENSNRLNIGSLFLKTLNRATHASINENPMRI